MLLLKPNCELCNKNLPPNSTDAYICSYECTFCESCVETVMANVCPNCGGGFCKRPIRPRTARREGVSLVEHPASTNRILTKYSESEIRAFTALHKNVLPQER